MSSANFKCIYRFRQRSYWMRKWKLKVSMSCQIFRQHGFGPVRFSRPESELNIGRGGEGRVSAKTLHTLLRFTVLGSFMTAGFSLYGQILCSSRCKGFASCWCGCLYTISSLLHCLSSLFLNESTLGAFTTCSGRKFHMFTALFGKTLYG